MDLELNKVYLGDCLEVMRTFPDNYISSIITDPPYGLGNDPDMVEVLSHWLNGDDYKHRGGGFMGKDWDSFVPGPAIWRECYRVLKPGGCLMAFGGTRTVDLLSIAIRLAGFQKFDEIVWLHGQGFGKGIAVDKGIDAHFGKLDERKVIGRKPGERYKYSFNSDFNDESETSKLGSGDAATITTPATEAAKLFSGYRSQLKPAHEVILCFWKPRESTFAKNALKWGVAGLNIDGCRVGTEGWQRQDKDVPGGFKTDKYLGEVGRGDYSMPQNGYRESTSGRYPANVLLSHHPDCVCTGVRKTKTHWSQPTRGTKSGTMVNITPKDNETLGQPIGYADPDGYETVEVWECVESCSIKMLGQQAGERPVSGSAKNGRPATGNDYDKNNTVFRRLGSRQGRLHNDSGPASRFFYTPKAPGREKWFYCQICDDCYPYAERDDHAHGKPKGKRKHQIAHPTVKPVTICNHLFGVLEYLCRLTKTPTGGIVLDPFGGSGTTALAAIANGRDFILIENDPIYHKIAAKRITKAKENPKQLKLL